MKRKAPSSCMSPEDNNDIEAGVAVASSTEEHQGRVSKACWIAELPDVIIYHILSFAARSGERAPFLASTLSLVSRSSNESIKYERSVLWEYILEEYSRDDTDGVQEKKRSKAPVRQSTRHSARLQRRTAQENVIVAYKILRDRTEDAIVQTAELSHDSQEGPLSLTNLRCIISAFAPLLINQRAKMGGTMLVECCRSRHVSEAVIRKCLAELIDHHGADPNIPAAVGHTGFEGSPLPPLVVAAARGMPTVVKLLLDKGANPYVTGTSRFRLIVKPKKSIKGDEYTPLQFAMEVKKAEEECGARKDKVKDLDKVIKILKRVTS